MGINFTINYNANKKKANVNLAYKMINGAKKTISSGLGIHNAKN